MIALLVAVAAGFFLFGICAGGLIEHFAKGLANDELATHCYRLEIELERLKRGGK